MRKHLLTFMFLAQSLMGLSQFSDDYFTNNPTCGNIEQFKEVVIISR